MSTALIIAGLVLTAVGLVIFLLPIRVEPSAHAAVDIGKILEEINKLLEKFDKRYRPGLILMLLGVTLVGLGVYLETKEAKDAVESSLPWITTGLRAW